MYVEPRLHDSKTGSIRDRSKLDRSETALFPRLDATRSIPERSSLIWTGLVGRLNAKLDRSETDLTWTGLGSIQFSCRVNGALEDTYYGQLHFHIKPIYSITQLHGQLHLNI